MKAKKILDYLNSQRINELKELLIQEITKKKNKKVPTYKAIQKLSLAAEKDLRVPRSKNSVTGEYKYTRPMLAGAYYLDGKTMITNGIWGAIFYKEIEGLKMVKEYGEYFKLDKVIPNYSNFVNTDFDLNEVKNKMKTDPEYKQIELGFNKFDLKLLVPLYECFEEPVILTSPEDTFQMLIIKGKNGIGILLPLRR